MKLKLKLTAALRSLMIALELREGTKRQTGKRVSHSSPCLFTSVLMSLNLIMKKECSASFHDLKYTYAPLEQKNILVSLCFSAHNDFLWSVAEKIQLKSSSEPTWRDGGEQPFSHETVMTWIHRLSAVRLSATRIRNLITFSCLPQFKSYRSILCYRCQKLK